MREIAAYCKKGVNPTYVALRACEARGLCERRPFKINDVTRPRFFVTDAGIEATA